MNPGSGLASGASWNVAGRAFQIVLSLVSLAVIARIVGPQVYGIFAITVVILGLIEIAIFAVPTDTLSQRRELGAGHCNSTFLVAMAIATLSALVLVSGADLLAAWFGQGELLEAILPYRAAALPLIALSCVPNALLRRANRFKAIAGSDAAAGIVASIVGIIAAIKGAGIWSLVVMELARQLVIAVLQLRLSGWRPAIACGVSDLKDLAGFGSKTFLAWTIEWAENALPQALISRFLGAEALGLYVLAKRFFAIVSSVLMAPAYQVLMPAIAQVQDDRLQVGRLSSQVFGAVVVMAAPIFLGLAAIAMPLVPLVLGGKWIGAVPVTQVMMVLGLLSAVQMVQLSIIRGMGRAGWHVGLAAMGLALTGLLVALALAASLGLVWVAAAEVASLASVSVVCALLIGRDSGFPAMSQLAVFLRPSLAAAAMFAGTLAFVAGPASDWPAALSIPAAIPIGALLYFLALHLFAPRVACFVRAALGCAIRLDRKGFESLLRGF
jgi:O-antigen/teichoic acid export membrane protein